MAFEIDHILRCPVTGSHLRREDNHYVAGNTQRYPVVHGVPVLLTKKEAPTQWLVNASVDAANERPDDKFHEDTIGVSPQQLADLKKRLESHRMEPEPVDPVISFLVGATSGYMYLELTEKLKTIPIPQLRLPPPNGEELLLDIGCNWGRWSIAAAQAGYRVIGIDPSLGAVLAAQRLSRDFGLGDNLRFVVADALQLPFAPNTFDILFSYSVLQHFATENAITAIKQASFVSKERAKLMFQMPNRFGLRSLFHQVKRGFRQATGFHVRYYSPLAIKRIYSKHYGPSRLSVDGFFGLGIQPSDRHLMPWKKRMVIDASEALRRLSSFMRPLTFVADSLYVTSNCNKIEM